MADFVSVLRRAVENLQDNNEAARQALYGKARAALLGQLRALDPPLGADELERQTQALDAAIASLETEYALAETGLDALFEPTPDDAAQAAEHGAPAAPPAPPSPPAGYPPAPRPDASLRATLSETERLGGASAEAARQARSTLGRMDQAAPAGPPRLAGDQPAQPYDAPRPPRPAGQPTAADRQPPPPAIYEDVDADTGGGAGRLIAWIVLALVVVGIAGVAYWQRDALTGMIASLSGGEVAEDDGKIVDRVPGIDTPGEQAATPPESDTPGEPPAALPGQVPSTTPPAADTEGERIAQALLIEEGADGAASAPAGGVIDWSLVDDPDAAGGLSKVIEGRVRVPDKDLGLTVTIRRNLDQALPASHLVELVFQPGPNFPGGGVTGVPGLLMKATPRSAGQPLVGAVVPVMDGYFLVGLSESEIDRQRNIAELRSRAFIDIPINYSDGGRAVLSLAKGETGTKVFEDAFALWDQAPASAEQ